MVATPIGKSWWHQIFCKHLQIHFGRGGSTNPAAQPRGAGGGGALDFQVDGGGATGFENLTLSQCARRTKNTPCHNIPYKKLAYSYPVLICTPQIDPVIMGCAELTSKKKRSSPPWSPESIPCHKHCGPGNNQSGWFRYPVLMVRLI